MTIVVLLYKMEGPYFLGCLLRARLEIPMRIYTTKILVIETNYKEHFLEKTFERGSMSKMGSSDGN
jgi:hypothetical protein